MTTCPDDAAAATWFKRAMSDAVFSDPLDLKKVETRAWFEHLRDRIHAAFEAL